MQAGDIDFRIYVQRIKASATADAAGHVDETDDGNWETYFECWSKFIPLGSREFFGARQVQGDVTGQFKVRRCTETLGVNTRMRVKAKHESRKFNIAGPPFDPDGRRTELRFNATEVF